MLRCVQQLPIALQDVENYCGGENEIMGTVDKRFFVEAFENANLTHTKVAELLGMGKTNFSKWINGSRRLTLDEARKLAVVLNLNVDRVMDAAGSRLPDMPQIAAMVPVIGTVDESTAVKMYDEPIDYVEPMPSLPGDCVAILVRTVQPMGFLTDGVELFIPRPAGVIGDVLGRMSVIGTDDKQVRLAVPVRSKIPGRWELIPGKQAAKIEWACPVLATRS